MNRPSLSLHLLIAAALSLGLAIGCNPGEALQQAQNAAKRDVTLRSLKELGLAYHNYHDAHFGSAAGKGAPESWEHLQEAGLGSEARQTLEREGYKLILGFEMPQVTIGTSNFMIAYPANPSGEPIVVGMLDGSARALSQAEFNDLLTQQQPLLAEAIVVEPSAGGTAPSAPAASSTPSNSPYVPPPPPPPSGS